MRFCKLFIVLAFLFLLMPVGKVYAQNLQVNQVSITPESRGELVTIQLSSPAARRIFALEGPPRIVIDLPPFTWQVPGESFRNYRGQAVKNVRYARFNEGTSRIVLDLAASAGFSDESGAVSTNVIKIRLLSKGGMAEQPKPQLVTPAPQRAAPPPVITRSPQDMGTTTMPAMQPAPSPKPMPRQQALPRELPPLKPAQPMAPPPTLTQPTTPPTPAAPIPEVKAQPVSPPVIAAPVPVQKPSSIKPLIAIDAGHGGKDPGAQGSGKTLEKEITLNYARALKDALLDTGRYRVVMTRWEDEYLPLRDRTKFAKKSGADLFVSLHADSAPSVSARGLSIYTLSEEASDSEAAMLAAQENKVDMIYGMDLTHEDKDVANILIDLAQRDTKNKSIELADRLVQAFSGKVNLLPNTHRFAGFAVLKLPDTPSVLVEIGFISHPEEERLMKTAAHRSRVISGIIRGIDSYFANR
jgi:N-acetylmuramoyl-L-alanine amidase